MSSGAIVTGAVCVTVKVLKTPATCMFFVLLWGLRASTASKAGLDSGDEDWIPWPRPASIWIALSGTLKRTISSLRPCRP